MSNSAFTVIGASSGGGGSNSPLATQSVAGLSTFTLSGLSATYFMYELIGVNLLPSTLGANLTMIFNGDTGNNYSYTFTYSKTNAASPGTVNGAVVASIPLFLGMSNIESSNIDINLYNPSANDEIGITWNGQNVNNDVAGNLVTYNGAAHRFAPGVITNITVALSAGTFTTGTFKLYGWLA